VGTGLVHKSPAKDQEHELLATYPQLRSLGLGPQYQDEPSVPSPRAPGADALEELIHRYAELTYREPVFDWVRPGFAAGGMRPLRLLVGTAQFSWRDFLREASPLDMVHATRAVREQLEQVEGELRQEQGFDPSRYAVAQRRDTSPNETAPPLSPNEEEWQATITRVVTDYRLAHHGASPSVRAFALAASGADTPEEKTRAVKTWTSRIKTHPRIVDPALNWPAGEAMARPRPKN
jgi:hypothetical protein